MSSTETGNPSARSRPSETKFRRARAGAGWDERCAVLFDDLRKPARVMVARAFGSAFSPEEVEDVYANAWASTLAALRGRGERMSDDELRAYLLTAVANHASKEMRRRSRKPTSPIEDVHAQVLADSHQPAPDELAEGAETGSAARDVLSSLPKRRRAVMLLRYGWGLQPDEICSLVDGLSPRAYRKEITRGVGEMIERLGELESGEWCRSREPLLRDYVAGTGDEETRLQALQHIGHCRHCNELVARLSGQLHDFGSGVAWTAVAGSLGEQKLSLGERVGGLLDRGRESATSVGDGIASVEPGTSAAASVGARGAGAAGAGVLAKAAGLGAAGKLVLACTGAGMAATACFAGGILPGAAGKGGGEPGGRSEAIEHIAGSAPALGTLVDSIVAEDGFGDGPGGAGSSGGEGGDGSGGDGKAKAPSHEPAAEQEVATAPEGAPQDSVAPTAAPVEQEFGLPAAAPASSSGGSGASSGGSSGSGGSAGGADVSKEFGP